MVMSRVRLEADVGICLRLIGNHHQRLSAVMKERYSDFHVNEIGPDGNIVRLTSLALPVDQLALDAVNDPSILLLVPQEERDKVAEFQRRLESADKKEAKRGGLLAKETVEIKVTDLDKESRTLIHRWISSFDKLSSETLDKGDGDKFIKIVPMTGNRHLNRRPANRGKFTHCVLYKEGVETGEAIGFLSQKLNMKPGLFSYAGIKDKRAKTAQRLAVSNVDAGRLAGICKYSRNGIKLGNFSYSSKPIALGELKGNHFKLLLKDLQLSKEDLSKDGGELDLESVVNLGVNSLSTLGFINYYGLQRFGSYDVSTSQVGREILRQNWIQAFDLLLAPKNNDHPSMASAKRVWFADRKPGEALKLLHSRSTRSIESSLLHGLAKYYARNDFVGVFQSLPRHSRLLYVHAYQSLLWNRGANRRIQEYGTEGPVVGDLVFVGDGEEEEVVELVEDCGKDDQSREPQTISSALRKRQEVRPLSQEDIEAGTHTIYDVLLPFFGSEVIYPENKMKYIFAELLKEEGIGPDCFANFRPIPDRPTGGYRKLLVRPTNVSHKLRKYSSKTDCLDKFIPSDLDLLQEKETVENKVKDNEIKANKEEITSPQKEEDKTCLILEFSLPSSSYATMALREILVEEQGPINKGVQKLSSEKEETNKNASILVQDEEPLTKVAKIE